MGNPIALIRSSMSTGSGWGGKRVAPDLLRKSPASKRVKSKGGKKRVRRGKLPVPPGD